LVAPFYSFHRLADLVFPDAGRLLVAQIWPLERHSWAKTLLFHLVVSLVLAILHWLTESILINLLWKTQLTPMHLSTWLSKMSYKFHIHVLVYFAVSRAYYGWGYYNQYRTYQYCSWTV
jgi:hypothetical protein